eukprot:TRINITY_DN6942_c0_g1_i1.p1 TRINITY_DN6942_c0_g1~~TRINITY_DN6942_c0_g1_i1.p1  ORF type:complete len:124 (-),score=23.61 TRINITY_DN6942_c0_g1_i1:76-447(-)
MERIKLHQYITASSLLFFQYISAQSNTSLPPTKTPKPLGPTLELGEIIAIVIGLAIFLIIVVTFLVLYFGGSFDPEDTVSNMREGDMGDDEEELKDQQEAGYLRGYSSSETHTGDFDIESTEK